MKNSKKLSLHTLDKVIGGATSNNIPKNPNKFIVGHHYCEHCKTDRAFYEGSGGRSICSKCYTQLTIGG